MSAKILSELSNDITPFNPVDGVLRTRYTRQDFYKREFKRIEPVEVKFKNERSIHFVPIKKSLAALLADVTVQQALITDNVNDSKYLSNFSDGTLCKVSAYFKQDNGAICLLLLQDAFEASNPLGSAKKKHGVLGMYSSVANLPSHFTTKVHNIQLVMVCYESTLVK